MPLSETISAKLTKNPYADAGEETLAAAVPDANLRPGAGLQNWARAAEFMTQLWMRAQDALAYWAPDKIEGEARARALDGAPTSVLAREVQVFTVRYLDYSLKAVDIWTTATAAHIEMEESLRKLRHVTEQFEKTLLALERRAMAVEARAMDLRMRYGFAELKRAFELGRMAETVVQVLAPMPESPNEEHLRQIAAMLEKKLEPFAADLTATKAEVTFVADNVTRELGEKWAGPERLKRYATALVSMATSSAAKLLLGQIASK